MAIEVYALHGFLGKPSDWDFLASRMSNFKFHAVDLFHNLRGSLEESAASFNTSYIKPKGPRILVGYSLGGRFALHALAGNPHLWQGAVIISAHPGLKCEEEKKDRLAKDAEWAEKFEKDPWNALLNNWNGQEIFNRKRSPWERSEIDFSRSELSQALRSWSLGWQKDLAPFVSQLTMPILWIAGEEDKKMVQLSQTLSFRHPCSKVWIAPKAGHRVPWEAMEPFCMELNHFIAWSF